MVYITLYLLSAVLLLFLNLKLLKSFKGKDLDGAEITLLTVLSLIPIINLIILVMLTILHFFQFLSERINWYSVVKFVNKIV